MWTKLTFAAFCILPCVFIGASYGQDITTDDHEYAQLGIEVTDSPGIGVQVGVVAVDGPADHGGIRAGDYVMAINGKPIEKPNDLVATLRVQKPGTEVTVNVWHEGKESERKVVLATPGSTIPSSTIQRVQRGWLGVTLEANGTVGGKIRQVIPGSPAATAKLKAGDVIVAINEAKVESAKDFVIAMQSHIAGETVTLTLGGEKEIRREVKLGSIAAAPPIFSYRMPITEKDELLPDSFTTPPAWRQEMSDLRRQLQELRKAIREQGKGVIDLDDEDVSDESDLIRPQPDDASNIDSDKALFQFGDYQSGRRSNRGYQYRQRPNYRYSYRYRPSYGYWYGYRPRPLPYTSYYGGYPVYRQYYRPGVRVYVGPFGFEYYYR